MVDKEKDPKQRRITASEAISEITDALQATADLETIAEIYELLMDTDATVDENGDFQVGDMNTDHLVLNCMRGGRLDCLHCGQTFPLNKFLDITGGLDVRYVSEIHKVFRRHHRKCELADEGRRLDEKEREYCEQSKVMFAATGDQLFELVNNIPEMCRKEPFKPDHPNYDPRHPDHVGPVPYAREEFDKLKLDRLEIEIYKLDGVENGYFFFRQRLPRWERELKKAGIKVLGEES